MRQLSRVIEVVVDFREAKSQVAEELRITPDVKITFGHLKVGDYLIENQCVFERKSMLDFARSLIDGRLFGQAERLASFQPRAALILEGRGRDLIGSEMRREALLGAIVSLTLIYDLPILRSTEPAETARLLLYAAGQLGRDLRDALPRRGRRPRSKRKVQLHLLQGLPGIGPKRAEQLLDVFGSVGSVMSADLAQLAALDGIGQKTAAGIRAALE